MFHSYLKNDKVLTCNIFHFPDFEISASLLLAPHLRFSKFNKRRWAIIRGNTVFDLSTTSSQERCK